MMWRKYHRYVGLTITLPLLLVVTTGIVLQLRNQFEWIQPRTVVSELKNSSPLLTLDAIVAEYPDADQIIYRPSKKNLSLRMKDGMDVQLHPQTGEVLKKSLRRTNLLIELHQGTWLGPWGQYGVYLVTGLGLLFLIVSGLFIFPFRRRGIL